MVITYYVVVMAYVAIPTSKPQRTSWLWHMLSSPYQSYVKTTTYFVVVMAYVVVPTSKQQHSTSWSWHTLSFPHQSQNILHRGHGILGRSQNMATPFPQYTCTTSWSCHTLLFSYQNYVKATTYYVMVIAYVVVPTSKPQHTTSWSCHTLSFPHQSHNVLRRGHGIRCRSQIKATIYNVVAMTYLVVPTT